MIKPVMVFILLGNIIYGVDILAAPRDSGGKAVAKLQTMIRDISSERDALRSERDAVKSELEKIKAEAEVLKREKTAAAALENQLNGELAAQKSSNEAINDRLDKTTAKLREVVDKYNALYKANNDLGLEHGQLKNTQKMTADELALCEDKNVKLYKAAREIVDNYQKRGVMDVLLDSEPLLGINNVETETLLQDYRDKLDKQKYRKTPVNESINQNQAPDKKR